MLNQGIKQSLSKICPQGRNRPSFPILMSSVQIGQTGGSSLPSSPFLQCYAAIFTIGSFYITFLSVGFFCCCYAAWKLASWTCRIKSSKPPPPPSPPNPKNAPIPCGVRLEDLNDCAKLFANRSSFTPKAPKNPENGSICSSSSKIPGWWPLSPNPNN